MMRYICFFLIAILCVGCNSTPDHVIPPEKMARLLADIHLGESVIDANRKEYELDSLKKSLKQSIYLKHQVSAEQVDTSFVWYGHNIEEYIKIYDQVIDLLEEDIAKIKVSADDEIQLAVVGDSADAWSGLRQKNITKFTPDKYLSFALNSDDNWEKGDTYEWKLKLINNKSSLNWVIAIDYIDGSSEFSRAQTTTNGWNSIKLISDSSKTATRIYGVAHIDLKIGERVYLDSISLIRTRLNPSIYNRRFNQSKFNYGKKNRNEGNK